MAIKIQNLLSLQIVVGQGGKLTDIPMHAGKNIHILPKEKKGYKLL